MKLRLSTILLVAIVAFAALIFLRNQEDIYDRVWREQSPSIVINNGDQTIDFRGIDSKFRYVCLSSVTEGPYGPEAMSVGEFRPYKGHLENMPLEVNLDRIIAFFYDSNDHILKVPIERKAGLSDQVHISYKTKSPSKNYHQCARRELAIAECIEKQARNLKNPTCLYLFKRHE